MTSTELRDALDAVAHAVEVPAVDPVAFQARVRDERRHRTGRRAAVGAVGAAAAVAAGLLVVPHSSPPTSPTRPAPDPVIAVAGQPYVPLLLDGKVFELLSDGSSYAEDMPAQEVLGSSAEGIVYLDPIARLKLAPLKRSGEPDRGVAFIGSDAVTEATLSGDGEQVAFRATDGTLQRTGTGSPVDLVTETDPGGRLVATDGSSWLTLGDDGSLTRSGDGAAVTFKDSEPAVDGQVAGDTVAYETASGVQLFDLDGTKRYGDLGAAIGALSPDGRYFVTAPDDGQRNTERIAPTLRLVDTHTGSTTTIDGWDTTQRVQSFWWQSSDRFLVLTTDPQQKGNRVLWTCSVSQDSCGQVYDDPSGTLALPAQ